MILTASPRKIELGNRNVQFENIRVSKSQTSANKLALKSGIIKINNVAIRVDSGCNLSGLVEKINRLHSKTDVRAVIVGDLHNQRIELHSRNKKITIEDYDDVLLNLVQKNLVGSKKQHLIQAVRECPNVPTTDILIEYIVKKSVSPYYKLLLSDRMIGNLSAIEDDSVIYLGNPYVQDDVQPVLGALDIDARVVVVAPSLPTTPTTPNKSVQPIYDSSLSTFATSPLLGPLSPIGIHISPTSPLDTTIDDVSDCFTDDDSDSGDDGWQDMSFDSYGMVTPKGGGVHMQVIGLDHKSQTPPLQDSMGKLDLLASIYDSSTPSSPIHMDIVDPDLGGGLLSSGDDGSPKKSTPVSKAKKHSAAAKLKISSSAVKPKKKSLFKAKARSVSDKTKPKTSPSFTSGDIMADMKRAYKRPELRSKFEGLCEILVSPKNINALIAAYKMVNSRRPTFTAGRGISRELAALYGKEPDAIGKISAATKSPTFRTASSAKNSIASLVLGYLKVSRTFDVIKDLDGVELETLRVLKRSCEIS